VNKELQIVNKDGLLVADSREVAEMLGKKHFDLLESIDGYIQHLENGNFRSQDFFIESSYKSEGNNKTYKCYLLTKKGCDMVANKMTGEKGVLFTAAYVTKFEEMEKALKFEKFKLPNSYAEALRQLAASVEEKEVLQLANKQKDQIIGELRPKADYTDAILKNKGLVTITQIAKDYGMI